MNLQLMLVGLRGLALLFALSDRQSDAERFYKLADLVDAGRVSDEQMREVAQLLSRRRAVATDFDDILERIETERERLHAPTPTSGQSSQG